MSKFEDRQTGILDGLVSAIKAILFGPTQKIKEQVEQQLGDIDSNTVDAAKTDRRILEIQKQYKLITNEFQSFAGAAIGVAWQAGAESADRVLRQMNLTKPGIDRQAIRILLQDAIRDFNGAAFNGERYIRTYFEISKQRFVTESQISEAVAAGLIDARNGRMAQQLVRQTLEDFSDAANPFTGERNKKIIDQSALARSVKRKQRRYQKARELLRDIKDGRIMASEGIRNGLLRVKRPPLEAGRYMQIINKNGDVMTFTTDYYAEMVTRTRIGEAQVQGVIDSSLKYDVSTFRVSTHGTTTEICKPHEGKIYTLDPKYLNHPSVDGMLTRDTRPLYHINCLHRINPVALRLPE